MESDPSAPSEIFRYENGDPMEFWVHPVYPSRNAFISLVNVRDIYLATQTPVVYCHGGVFISLLPTIPTCSSSFDRPMVALSPTISSRRI